MSIPLAEALKQVDLEVGRSYECQVNGYWIEVRVSAAPAIAPDLPESDIMLEAWTEFPDPPGGVVIEAVPGPIDPPDPIEIPSEEDEQ